MTTRASLRKPCQYCGKPEADMYVPAGNICDECKKALQRIRKHKLGFKWMPKGLNKGDAE